MARILERDLERYLWWKVPDIPQVRVENRSFGPGLGHIRQWIENELPNTHKVAICFHEERTAYSGIIKCVYIAFDSEEDYTAFKLVFPEHCK